MGAAPAATVMLGGRKMDYRAEEEESQTRKVLTRTVTSGKQAFSNTTGSI